MEKSRGIKGTAYQEALGLRIENDNLDDIIMVHHDDVLELAPEGRLADLSGLSTIGGFSETAKTQFTEKDGSVLVMNVDTCISVNARSDCLEEAKEFVEYLTQPGVIYEYCDTQSCYTPLEDDRTLPIKRSCLLQNICSMERISLDLTTG